MRQIDFADTFEKGWDWENIIEVTAMPKDMLHTVPPEPNFSCQAEKIRLQKIYSEKGHIFDDEYLFMLNLLDKIKRKNDSRESF